jgi:hypothetical protein
MRPLENVVPKDNYALTTTLFYVTLRY